MKWRGIVIGFVVASIVSGNVLAASTNVQISEVLVGTSASSRQEFIELYNGTQSVLDFTNGHWAVQIASSSATDWSSPSRTIYLNGFLYPNSHYLIGSTYTEAGTSNTYPVGADNYFASILSATAGHIRLIKSSDGQVLTKQNVSEVNSIEWGADSTKSISPGLYLTTKSIESGSSIIPSVNYDSLGLSATPTPQTDVASQPENDTPTSSDDSETDEAEPLPDSPTITDAQLRITELLPNPVSPQSDTKDEFIEIYNPSESAVNLKGYSLKVGIDKFKQYTFTKDVVIDADSYKSFYSADTKLSLSNTKSQVELLDPSGESIDKTAPYSNAADGIAWAYIGDGWQWTSKPTPNTANEMVIAVNTVKQMTKPTPLPIKKLTNTAKNVVAKRTAKPKTTNKVAPKKATKVKAVATSFKADKTPPKTSIHTAVLVVVLGLAILYGIYEYRADIINRIRRLGRHRKDSQPDWIETERRRNNRAD